MNNVMRVENRPLISVIIPVYNVEKYLDKCVQSVMKQTYKNLEIILVDDGSTDSGPMMCDEYADLDARIKVIHKENGGLSSARNVGIDVSTGDFLGFIDSDDYIDIDMIETLYNNLEKKEADLSVCGYYHYYEGKELKKESYSVIHLLSQYDAVKELQLCGLLTCSAVNKLYKRSIFEELRYPEGKNFEDAYIILDILRQCNTIVIDTNRKYYYLHRQGSITSTMNDHTLDIIAAYKRCYEIIEREYPDLSFLAMKWVYWSYFYVLDRIIISGKEEQYFDLEKQLIKLIKQGTKTIIKENFTKGRKVATLILFFSPALYKKIIPIKFFKYQGIE